MSNALENLENLLTKKQTKPIKKGNSGALQNLLNLHSTTRKKKTPTDKPRRVVYQRDKNGNRSYPYSGQQRKLVKNEHTKRSVTEYSTEELESNFYTDKDNSFVPDFQSTALESINVLLGNCFKSKSQKKKYIYPWKDRMENLEESWEAERQNVLENVISNSFLLKDEMCQRCLIESAKISCEACFHKRVCSKCDVQVHNLFPLHDRCCYVEGFKVCLKPMEYLDESMVITSTVRFAPVLSTICKCGSLTFIKEATNDLVIVVTMSGRFELMKFVYACTKCNEKQDPFTLPSILRSGFWPCHPSKFSNVVEVNVLRYWDEFRKQMPGSSERSFLETLNAFTLSNGRSGKINKSMFSQAFKQWCFCNREINLLQKKDWMKCPCCSIKQHSCHVDGNCKLYRYKSSGSRRRKSYYSDAFICADSDVEVLLSDVYKEQYANDRDITCGGEWSAARNTGRKHGSVDVTGLEVATCRHQFGQKAVNMKRGELYGYALFLIKNFMVPNRVEFVFADVMCKLWKFLKRVAPKVCSEVKGALSVMHAKGHSLDCQILWDGEWTEGTGRSTGEECEQVFSYLSRCSNTTKYQRPENREESITEHMLFWNERKTINLASSLAKKFKRVDNELKQKEIELQNLLSQLKLRYSDLKFADWLAEVKDNALSVKSIFPKISKLQAFVLLYHNLKPSLPTSVPTELKEALQNTHLPDLTKLKLAVLQKSKNEKERILLDSYGSFTAEDISTGMPGLLDVIKIVYQKTLETYCFERVHWSMQIKKSADTSKQRIIYRKKISQLSEKMKSVLCHLNSISVEKYYQSDVENGVFLWSQNVCVSSEKEELLTVTDKRHLVDLKAKVDRCKEELYLLKVDMESYLRFYCCKQKELKSQLELLSSDDNNGSLRTGEAALYRQGLKFTDEQIKKGLTWFCQLLSPDMLQNCDISYDLDEPAPHEIDDEVSPTDEVLPTPTQQVEISRELDIDLIKSLSSDLIESTALQNCFFFEHADVIHVYLPLALSQCQINGRNGSNACSVISLLVGYFVTQSSVLMHGFGVNNIMPVFVGCIEAGNILYDCGGFLHVVEAMSYLPDHISLNVSDEQNCFVENISTTMASHLSILHQYDYVIFVAAGKTICCVAEGGNVFVFDSHTHGEYGPSISCIPKDKIEQIVQCFNVESTDVLYSCIISSTVDH